MSIVQRIKEIAENEDITISELERKIGASRGVINGALRKNTAIHVKLIAEIAKVFPLYNTRWLLTGEGNIQISPSLAEKYNKSIPKINETEKKDWEIDRLKEENSQLREDIAQLNKTIGKLESQLEISDTSYKSNVG